jgi:hypothetical protein
MALVGLIVFCFVRQQNVQQEQEDEESEKRSLPESLLDEIEYETPLTLASTAVNRDFEPEANDFLSDGA